MAATSKPLVPSDCDLRNFRFMPIEIERLRRSRAWLVAKRQPELGFYMINLWMAAWHEVPAASLEDDDDVLADAAMCDPKKWTKIRQLVMRGWTKGSDGRLYHAVVAEKANEAWAEKQAYRARTATARAAKQQQKTAAASSVTDSVTEPVTTADPEDATDDATDPVTGDGTASVTALKGQGRERDSKGKGQVRDSKKLASSLDSSQLPCGIHLSRAQGSVLPADWAEAAAAERAKLGRPEADLQREWDRFIEEIGETEEPTLVRWIGWIRKAQQKRRSRKSRDQYDPDAPVPPTPWEKRCDSWGESKFWLADWGPKPDEPGCWAPRDLVEDARRKRAEHDLAGTRRTA